MADPKTLIPSDTAASHQDYKESFFSSSPWSKDEVSSCIASSRSGASSSGEQSEFGTLEKRTWIKDSNAAAEESVESGPNRPSSGSAQQLQAEGSVRVSKSDPTNLKKEVVHEIPERASYPYLQRSPSWAEGISPGARKMKVKDVSQYMIDAAKENPNLAQKLHDVLLESGVVAPANLFTEIYHEQASLMTAQEKEENRKRIGTKKSKGQGDLGHIRFLPPLPFHGGYSKGSPSVQQPDHSPLNLNVSSNSEVKNPVKYTSNVPVAAAAVRKNYDNLEMSGFAAMLNAAECARNDEDAVVTLAYDPLGSGEREETRTVRTFECPICCKHFVNVVSTACGHITCGSCLLKSIAENVYNFECKVCWEQFVKSFVANFDPVFCESCIIKSSAGSMKCPICRTSISVKGNKLDLIFTKVEKAHNADLHCGHEAAVLCVQWSPDKSSVFGSSAEDGALNIWDLEKASIIAGTRPISAKGKEVCMEH